ncbi:multidrug efflux SMR transporter [Paenibacillus sp. J2TS4]|uniref:DMT family transporter n=1 Tax=Paenibacillus sp. J2TS4 TaxID=2807194 RepID=UPI001B0B9B8D|nr:multidrug efflux SMR transporter [Paenibacillus sp. J2TS4]GIP34526.1 multidrug resistance protein SMR [Paenibacillus sp. J2TS4]
MNRNWTYVLIAALFEVGWVVGLKHANNILEWTGTVIAIIVSFGLLILSGKRLPVGTVYAVFTGLGTTGTVLMEFLVFGEPFKWAKVILIMVLLTGIIGLKVITKESAAEGAEA